MKNIFLIPFLLISVILRAQTLNPYSEKMQWFKDAKLGIFIHWGIYAVDGIDESWSFYNGYISHSDYLKQLNGFTAKNYNPIYWADLIKESGARYAVLTAKHHDGVALWNTKLGNLNVVRNTPVKKGLIEPYVKAIRDKGLKVGIYYSLIDWSYPDYPGFTRETTRYVDDQKRWGNFTKYNLGQIKELSEKFNPDLFWFDGDWEHTADEWKSKEIREQILESNPNAIINSRLNGYGDYETPEQGVPIFKPQSKYWELCMTTNDSWGYQHNDSNYKSPNQIINIFIDCISMGGNLLLDIGPKEDGTIPDEQVNVLKELGRWTKKHADAIYETNAGIPLEYYYGRTTLSKDSTILYLFVPNKQNGTLMLKGIKNKVNRIWIVGNGTKLHYKIVGKQYWSSVPGLLYIDVPDSALDSQVTVIAVLLDGKIDLYKEEIKKIESN